MGFWEPGGPGGSHPGATRRFWDRSPTRGQGARFGVWSLTKADRGGEGLPGP